MRALLSVVVAALIGATAAALAQQALSVAPVNVSQFATKADIQTLQAAMPLPASTVPPIEQVAGAAGSAPTYRRSDAVQPRITRSGRCMLDGTNTCTFDWTSQGALTGTVQPIIEPIYSGVGVPSCWPTAVSSTAISVKCQAANSGLITLAIVTSGLNLFSTSLTGTSVAVTAIPNS